MKTIFVINVANHIDLITNSSSELFILEGKTKEVIEEMVCALYPNYLSEYEELKNISEIDERFLNDYMYRLTSPHMFPATKSMYPIVPGFTFDELYEQKGDKPAWNGEMQYELRNNVKNPRHKYDRGFFTEENKEEYINKLCPNKDLWFLYSLDENPNYDMIEKLDIIGERIHLG